MSNPRIAAASKNAIAEAAALLRAGRLVAFPTETVYGLGGDATSEPAVRAIYAAKGRPSANPLIVHVPTVAAARRLVHFDARAAALAERFWPGPLTMVLPRRADCGIAAATSGGLETLAVRIPRHPLALALLEAAALPLAAPSANPSGRVSPTTARHVAEGLGERVALILDGGPCAIGLESTVVGLAGATTLLLRPGGVTREALEAVLGPLALPPADKLLAPGMMASHYAPALPLRLGVSAPRSTEALLAFGPDVPAGAAHVLNLSECGDLEEAASRLFAYLRALDRADWQGIAVMPIPESGIGAAINDRLRRAAAPRPT